MGGRSLGRAFGSTFSDWLSKQAKNHQVCEDADDKKPVTAKRGLDRLIEQAKKADSDQVDDELPARFHEVQRWSYGAAKPSHTNDQLTINFTAHPPYQIAIPESALGPTPPLRGLGKTGQRLRRRGHRCGVAEGPQTVQAQSCRPRRREEDR